MRSLDEQAGLSLPRRCVGSAHRKNISAKKTAKIKKQKNLELLSKKVTKSIVKIETVLRQLPGREKSTTIFGPQASKTESCLSQQSFLFVTQLLDQFYQN